MPEGFARWADAAAQSHTRTGIPFVGLGLLGALVCWRLGSARVSWGVFLGLMGLSVLLELGQLGLPGRHPTVNDVVWGWLGLLVGWGSLLLVRGGFRRKRD